ncbi:MAG: hypothetical protein M1812_004169 [Candelaria pacifica]|nr:MAG: hypothetical protein M1812_004169 [Candelaria pacifica]
MEHLIERQTKQFKPAGRPPPGVIPGQPNAPYKGDQIVAANAVFIPLTLLFLAARVYTRIRLTRSLGLDDFYLFIGMTFAIAQNAVTLIHLNYGLGHHVWDVASSTMIPKYLQLQFASILVYMLAIFFVKLSVLQLYLRIDTSKAYRITVWTLIALTIAYHFASLVAHFATCIPVSKQWYPRKPGHCFDKKKLAVSRAILNVVNDVVILLVPLSVLRKLQLPWKQKIALSAVFSTGIFVCIVTIIRLTHYISFLKSNDLTWDATDNYTWCIVEVNVGIICACMATLRPLFRRFLPKALGSTGMPASGTKISRPSGCSAGSQVQSRTVISSGKSAHTFSALESRGSEGVCREVACRENGGLGGAGESTIELSEGGGKGWS